MQGLTKLEFLDVSQTNVTDAGLAHLKGLIPAAFPFRRIGLRRLGLHGRIIPIERQNGMYRLGLGKKATLPTADR
jgi:hypothetical protein